MRLANEDSYGISQVIYVIGFVTDGPLDLLFNNKLPTMNRDIYLN